ncbi:hypothetical protein AWM79_13335 [Pseudomonas agarici]|uniref:Uncharacterized protein n=3 Tax=Pseudomonas agarici TaxID=46677 RepID=A0A0X1T2H7_PSEAA|nr:hypothetical protein [Pseudomonas agarici]AMB86231.1 hypothetical protein AWM79_13335 [Pseudomonas agarici]NWC08854.1 hypothetical protein [Pseudomonas agarici]SEK59655.1 hypothetical protein SAMN05216604_104190 [Pseudomonas agarici]
MMHPFAPFLSFPSILPDIFRSERSEKNSKASLHVQTINNAPHKTEVNTRVDVPESSHKETPIAAKTNPVIDLLRTQQNNAQELKNSLLNLKEKIDSVKNLPNKGTLRYSETKGLYLSNSFKILEAVGLRDAGAAKFEKKINGLDLEFGKITDKDNIISKIDEKLDTQDGYIKALEDRVQLQEEKFAAARHPMSGENSNAPHEMKGPEVTMQEKSQSAQYGSTGDELSEWPQKNPGKQFLHSVISNNLGSDQEDLVINENELLQYISTFSENPENSYSQSSSDTTNNPTAQVNPQSPTESINKASSEQKDNKSGALSPPQKPPRTFKYGGVPSASSPPSQTKPAQPVPDRPNSDRIPGDSVDSEFDQLFASELALDQMSKDVIEKEFNEMFTGEEKTPIGQEVPPPSLVKRSDSEAGTRSVPIRPSRKIDAQKGLERSQSDPTNNTTQATQTRVEQMRAFWEAQFKANSTTPSVKR